MLTKSGFRLQTRTRWELWIKYFPIYKFWFLCASPYAMAIWWRIPCEDRNHFLARGINAAAKRRKHAKITVVALLTKIITGFRIVTRSIRTAFTPLSAALTANLVIRWSRAYPLAKNMSQRRKHCRHKRHCFAFFIVMYRFLPQKHSFLFPRNRRGISYKSPFRQNRWYYFNIFVSDKNVVGMVSLIIIR